MENQSIGSSTDGLLFSSSSGGSELNLTTPTTTTSTTATGPNVTRMLALDDQADDAIWILTSTFIIFTMQSGKRKFSRHVYKSFYELACSCEETKFCLFTRTFLVTRNRRKDSFVFTQTDAKDERSTLRAFLPSKPGNSFSR